MADHMKKYKDADYRFSVISKLVFTGFTPTLAKQLAKEAGVNVRTVKDGTKLIPKTIISLH